MPIRRTLAETWDFLDSLGWRMTRDDNGEPLLPTGMPNFDDDGRAGFSRFRSGLDADHPVGGLTLPRCFFGRSWFQRARFVNTDLHESRMCWNDFDECDFTDADLSGCDLRASIFRRCKFVGARLWNANLRRSSIEGCDFTAADLSGAVIEKDKRSDWLDVLTAEQVASVA